MSRTDCLHILPSGSLVCTAIHTARLVAALHLDVARDIQATRIQCPSECLGEQIFHLNSRNCMSLFIAIPEHQGDMVFSVSRDFSSSHPPCSSPSAHPFLPPPSPGWKMISRFDWFFKWDEKCKQNPFCGLFSYKVVLLRFGDDSKRRTFFLHLMNWLTL